MTHAKQCAQVVTLMPDNGSKQTSANSTLTLQQNITKQTRVKLVLNLLETALNAMSIKVMYPSLLTLNLSGNALMR